MQRRLEALLGAAALMTVVVVSGVVVALTDTSPASSPVAEAVSTPDRNFAAAIPGDPLSRGGAGLRQPACRVSQITTSAVTTRSADGVVGVITIIGRGCSLDVSPLKLRLLSALGTRLAVGDSFGNPINPTFSTRPDIPEGYGSIRIGFAWNGSYCGPPAAEIELDLYGQPFPIALKGPSPPCIVGLTSSLAPGIVDGPGVPVIPAPLAFEALRARVVLPGTVPRGPVPVTVVLTNVGTHDVSLASPCPAYRISLTHIVDFAEQTTFTNADLCSRALTVRAGGSLRLPLGRQDAPGLVRSDEGDRITVTWSMAGVSPASASTFVR